MSYPGYPSHHQVLLEELDSKIKTQVRELLKSEEFLDVIATGISKIVLTNVSDDLGRAHGKIKSLESQNASLKRTIEQLQEHGRQTTADQDFISEGRSPATHSPENQRSPSKTTESRKKSTVHAIVQTIDGASSRINANTDEAHGANQDFVSERRSPTTRSLENQRSPSKTSESRKKSTEHTTVQTIDSASSERNANKVKVHGGTPIAAKNVRELEEVSQLMKSLIDVDAKSRNVPTTLPKFEINYERKSTYAYERMTEKPVEQGQVYEKKNRSSWVEPAETVAPRCISAKIGPNGYTGGPSTNNRDMKDIMATARKVNEENKEERRLYTSSSSQLAATETKPLCEATQSTIKNNDGPSITPGAPYNPGYPQQHGGPPYPLNNPPYPSAATPPPGSSSVFPPNIGFRADAPLYMPPPSGYPYTGTTTSYPISSHLPPNFTPGNHTKPYPGPPAPPASSYPSSRPLGLPYPSATPPGPTHSSYPRSSSPYTSYPRTASPNTSYGPGGSHPTNTSYPHGTTHSSSHAHSLGHHPSSHAKKTTPTVVPAQPFDPRGDAEILRKAMKGFGTDEKAIIYVLSQRTNAQRLQIAVEFKTLYGKDLIKDLKSETSGKFEDLLVALMTPLPQYYAKELQHAISGLGTDEDVLIEVLCTKTNSEIRTIRQAYHSMFGRTLEDDLIGDTSGTFKRLMVSLCNACRDESVVTNPAAAAADAQALLRAGELKLGTDESTFNMVLCQRSYAQLRLIFDEYYRITGHDFEQAIKNEFSGNSKDCLLAIVRSIRNQPGFFAKCLQKSIAGLGTNDRKLIRVVVTRCEIDMGEIKQNYLAQYGETLADAIKGDTSGDYKKLLLALIGEPK